MFGYAAICLMKKDKGGKVMALIMCPECGGKLSDTADFCPHCGYNQFKREEKTTNYISDNKKSICSNQYIDMTEKELNSLVEQYIKKTYPQLFGNDINSQQKEAFDVLEDIFEALEKINSQNELLLMKKKYAKIPYLHLALHVLTSQYIAISKEYFDETFNITFSDEYKEIGLRLEVMPDDFGEVLVLEEKYNKFLEFSSLYHKIRFKEKESIQGNYLIYQYGSSVDSEHQLSNTHVSLHLGDCCLVSKELHEHTIKKIILDSAQKKTSEVNLATRAAIGGIIAGPVGSIVGVASGIDKNSKIQNSNTVNGHIEYINDNSYILSLTSNIVYGIKFSFLINENRTNYVKFNNVIYEKMDDLYIELKRKLLLAQKYRQQMYAWISVYNDITEFEEDSDKSLKCLESYNRNLYNDIIEEINKKEHAKLEEKAQKKNQYMLSIEEIEKTISEWQDKYELYKNKKFGEGKKMRDYCFSQLRKFHNSKQPYCG